MVADKDILLAHKHCAGHREDILSSASCGCFYCLAIFPPTEVEDWIEENPDNTADITLTGQTALCPKCGIDSVIGSASGYPITADFLQRMNRHWF
jgi:hypothetical protein